MTEHRSPIPARVYNAAVGGHVCGPEDLDFGQKVVHLIKYDRTGNEVSFESQVIQANKIYIIHDDFVLSSNVTIPANCVLEFDGGSISGAYTITGTNTCINANLVKILDIDVILTGSWNVVEAYPEWFGAKGDGVTDDRDALQKTFDIFDTISLRDVEYAVNAVDEDGIHLKLPKNRYLKGHRINYASSSEEKINIKSTNSNSKVTLYLYGKCKIENLYINGASTEYKTVSDIDKFKACIRSNPAGGGFINLKNVHAIFGDIGFDLAPMVTQIENCKATYLKIGFYIHGGKTEGIVTGEETSTTMIGCYSAACRINGFRIEDMTYSSFINLACDVSGFYVEKISSHSDVNPVYHFIRCNCCNVINCGAELCLKNIYLENCKCFNVSNCRFVYGFENAQLMGDTYTPAMLYSFTYCRETYINGIQMLYGGDGYTELRNLVTSTSPLIYIEDIDINEITYHINNMIGIEKGNVSINGFIKQDCIKFDNFPVTPKIIEISSNTSLLNTLKSIDFESIGTPNTIRLIFTENNEAGFYTKNTINLQGKTIILTSKNKYIISCYGQNQPLVLENGKVIFVNITFYDTSASNNRVNLFEVNNCDIEMYNCTFTFSNTGMTDLIKSITGTEKVVGNTVTVTNGQNIIDDNLSFIGN